MRNILAHILDENGRPSKKLIPPRSVGMIMVEAWTGVDVCSSYDLVKRCLFVVNLPYHHNQPIWLFNGGLENQWVQHGDVVGVTNNRG